MNEIIKQIEDAQLKEEVSKFNVGDTVKINEQGKFEKVVSNGALRVVSILPTHLPVMMAPGKKGQKISLMPQAGLKIKLEVVR